MCYPTLSNTRMSIHDNLFLFFLLILVSVNRQCLSIPAVPLLVQYIYPNPDPSHKGRESLPPRAKGQLSKQSPKVQNVDSNIVDDAEPDPDEPRNTKERIREENLDENSSDGKISMMIYKIIHQILVNKHLPEVQNLLNKLAVEYEKTNMSPKLATKDVENNKEEHKIRIKNENIVETNDMVSGLVKMITELIGPNNKTNVRQMESNPDNHLEDGELTNKHNKARTAIEDGQNIQANFTLVMYSYD